MAYLGTKKLIHSLPFSSATTTRMVCYNHICVYAGTAAALAEVPTQTTERETKPALMNIGSFGFDTYSSLLQESNSLSSLKQVHAHMLGTGSVHNVYLGTKLISMYAKTGSLVDARLVFDHMPERSVFSWNNLMGGYARDGQWEEIIKLYREMHHQGVRPDNFTFPFAIKACSGLSALKEGKEIQQKVIRCGCESDVFVASCLVDMYAKRGSIEDARQVFDKITERDVVCWTAMISGYAQNGLAKEALALFHEMQVAGIVPDAVSMGMESMDLGRMPLNCLTKCNRQV
jgi:pentatricopeptide repeat protein